MANQQHLDILKQGVRVWNQWRQEHPDVMPRLRRADLRGFDFTLANLHSTDFGKANLINTNLRGADLSKADLGKADLIGADLSEAILNEAYFRGADLRGANLSNANLHNADLISVDFRDANLNNADLTGADLRDANLNRASLQEADLTGAYMGLTSFGNTNLSSVKGLEAVNHLSPSSIGLDTIFRSSGHIPEVFLRGIGVPESFITYIRSFNGKPNDYYTCLISYSSKDQDFAERLYADLQKTGIRCWFAPEDLKIGEHISTGIDETIRLQDRLLLILSKSSVASAWVEHAVKSTLEKESKEKRVILFPVRLDTAILESPLSWATEIRHTRNIGDFSHWKNHDDYQKALSRLIRDLIAELPNELEPKR